ncbi:hypothetical protein [Sessilibacter corallicola]|uniref:hypothetical protein n=1 Tax=Sessilibacter corallicola TaxID=2904075 RepID=UPI001E5B8C14|nr:hypothetical protein [Sessilibacter corallicola]MCE2029243.1 hypothetical protein [Sessilibacter corallicola]
MSARISSVTITFAHPDGSECETKIFESDSSVVIFDGNDSVAIYPKAWPEIKDQIDSMIKNIEES